MHATKCTEVLEHIAKHLKSMCDTLIPEEIVILNNLLKKHDMQGRLSEPIEAYLEKNMDDMETEELSKVYISCLKNNIPLTESF